MGMTMATILGKKCSKVKEVNMKLNEVSRHSIFDRNHDAWIGA